MKKLTFLLLAAISGLTASAQTEKGTHWLGGVFSVNHSDYNQSQEFGGQSMNGKYRQNSYQVGPSYTYFVADQLSLSAEVGYAHSHADQKLYDLPNAGLETMATETSVNSYIAGLGLNKYFLYEDKIGVRTGPNAHYQRMKSKVLSEGESESYDATTKSFDVGISLDFVYFPVKKIGLIASLGRLAYSEAKTEGLRDTNKQTNLDLRFFGNSTSLSFVYVFGKK